MSGGIIRAIFLILAAAVMSSCDEETPSFYDRSAEIMQELDEEELARSGDAWPPDRNAGSETVPPGNQADSTAAGSRPVTGDEGGNQPGEGEPGPATGSAPAGAEDNEEQVSDEDSDEDTGSGAGGSSAGGDGADGARGGDGIQLSGGPCPGEPDGDDVCPAGGDADEDEDGGSAGEDVEIAVEAGNSNKITDKDGERRETFEFGPDAVSPLVDFLFVIDNSCSMRNILNKVSAGMRTIATRREVLPEKPLMAVMSTMVAKFDDFSTTGPGVSRYSTIDEEPGFLAFVDKAAIDHFRTANPAMAGNWSIDGCTGPWFAPDATNGNGQYCIEAATQASLSCLGAEAGITAFEQLLKKHAGRRLFRQGAQVNVIFVSDTHDPGINNATLRANIKSYDELRALAARDNVQGGLKFHAIAPFQKCVESFQEASYFDLTDASGGRKGDVCTETDYAEVLSEVVETGARRGDPVFVLSRPVTKLVSVTLDGVGTTDYTFDSKNNALTIPGLAGDAEGKVEVVYRY